MKKDQITLLDLFGPVMMGPSSSHTAGVARIARMARHLLSEPVLHAEIQFYGSLAHTWKGHGSGKAVLAGLLDMKPDDYRLPDSERHAKESGLKWNIQPIYDFPEEWHVNTVVLDLRGASRRMKLRGASTGGGTFLIQELDDFQVSLNGELDALLVLHHDEVGVIACVSKALAFHGINIASILSHRKEKGDEALLVVEMDTCPNNIFVNEIIEHSFIYNILIVPRMTD